MKSQNVWPQSRIRSNITAHKSPGDVNAIGTPCGVSSGQNNGRHIGLTSGVSSAASQKSLHVRWEGKDD